MKFAMILSGLMLAFALQTPVANACDDASCKMKKGAKACQHDAQKDTESATTEQAPIANPQSYTLNVTGMHCESCVGHLKKELSKLSEVEQKSIKIDLKGKTATVTMAKGSPDALKKTLNEKLAKSGFTITEVKAVN